MASARPRKDKNGEIIGYQLRVSRGRGLDGKQLKSYTMEWKPGPNMTPRQIQKELQRQLTLFEEACAAGSVSIEQPRFAEYAEYVLGLKQNAGAKPKSIAMYRNCLKRINAEFGTMKLKDIRVDHLNQFYVKLAKPGERTTRRRATPTKDLNAWLKKNNLSQEKLAELAGVGHSSVAAIAKKHTVWMETAEKVAAAMGVQFSTFFKAEKATSETLSPTTIHHHHKTISTILEQATKEGLIPFNPAERATAPKQQKHEPEFFEVEEVQTILEALEEEPLRYKVMTYLLIFTGARKGEVMGLKWDAVNWKTNQLDLVENRTYCEGFGTTSGTLKTGESRTVTVSQEVMSLLKQWRVEQTTLFSDLGVTPSGYVLTNDDGQPMHPDRPTSWLNSFSKRHGLPHIHPHQFRHTMASLLIADGLDILTVSKRLGHAKVSTTLDIYAHALKKSDEVASTAFDNLIFKDRKQA
jgi:integrase